jgi:hypothetical protein
VVLNQVSIHFDLLKRLDVYLVVPAERRESHSNIGPRYSHPRDIRFDEPEQGIRDNGDVVQIPGILGVRIQWVRLYRGHRTVNLVQHFV